MVVKTTPFGDSLGGGKLSTGGQSAKLNGSAYGSYPKQDTWFPQVYKIMYNAGVPDWIWLPIMLGESSGNPKAVSRTGNSIGLFQLNRAGGQGSGHSVSSLENPVTNATIAAPALATAYHKEMTTLAATRSTASQLTILEQVAALGGHAGLDPQYGGHIVAIFNTLNAGRTVAGFGESGKGSTLGGGVNLKSPISVPNPFGWVSGAESWLSSHVLTWIAIIIIAVVMGVLLIKAVTGGKGLPIPVPV